MEWLNQIPLTTIVVGAGLLVVVVGLWVLVDRFVNPTGARMDRPDSTARLTGACGDTMEVKLKIRDGIVTAASYWADGCGPSSACAAAATQLSIGTSIDDVPEAAAPEAVERAVGGLPEDQRHCAALASETVLEAAHRYMKMKRGGAGKKNPESCMNAFPGQFTLRPPVQAGMTMQNPIIEAIGEKEFQWLAHTFGPKTTLQDVPGDILERVASVDISVRDYAGDVNSLTAIALITFAYEMAGRTQTPQSGPKDIRLVKSLAKGELSKRQGRSAFGNPLWEAPLVQLIMGTVGERIRAMRALDAPG